MTSHLSREVNRDYLTVVTGVSTALPHSLIQNEYRILLETGKDTGATWLIGEVFCPALP